MYTQKSPKANGAEEGQGIGAVQVQQHEVQVEVQNLQQEVACYGIRDQGHSGGPRHWNLLQQQAQTELKLFHQEVWL